MGKDDLLPQRIAGLLQQKLFSRSTTSCAEFDEVQRLGETGMKESILFVREDSLWLSLAKQTIYLRKHAMRPLIWKIRNKLVGEICRKVGSKGLRSANQKIKDVSSQALIRIGEKQDCLPDRGE